MCRPIRTLTDAKGHDAALHDLASFGGAGGQHACFIARVLGGVSVAESHRNRMLANIQLVKRVLIHKYSSVLSAYGMALADVVVEERTPSASIYNSEHASNLTAQFEKLETITVTKLSEQGISSSRIVTERYLNMRFHGSDTPLMVKVDGTVDPAVLFRRMHQKEFGFLPIGRDIIIDDYRVRAIGQCVNEPLQSPIAELRVLQTLAEPKHGTLKPVYFQEVGWYDTPIFNLNLLATGTRVSGPALIMDDTQTLVLSPDSIATILTDTVVINLTAGVKKDVSATKVDPIQLSIFGHRFMGIAEQAGRALQKTAVSTNIKERLDFSCTVFSPDGGLVANAPHVPAMIGSMAYAVKWQIDYWKDDIKPGDVILTNSPDSGGTHLPDLTVITPVFDKNGKSIIFWTASRGHHADIGGILPGSMPPNSKELWEEGAVIKAFKVIENGIFKEEELTNLLMAPAGIEGCSGTRCLQDNISDVKAQAAANHRGSQLIHALIEQYSLATVQFYMEEIQGAAESAVRDMLKTIAQRSGTVLQAVDYMDDGTKIALKVIIDENTGSATFDFEGTGPEVYGNWNAPIAICNSSIIFALRCMVDREIPLNQGAIRPIDVRIPKNSLLRPSAEAACCAGNVLTSQRIVDVIFLAFQASAASQGCMNNLTFGSDDSENGFGYYETICGGSGAGPTWKGTSGVHTNMTNTRITDPEILERRYPVVLRRFDLRPGSGGVGLHNGGDGIVRTIEFSMPMKVSILSERRAIEPYGLAGAENGQRGENLWVKTDGRVINLGGKNTAMMGKGDKIVIQSPGGGGWGVAKSGTTASEEGLTRRNRDFIGRANGSALEIMAMGESA